MKVVHALGWYFPESSGGSEVYVSTLARHLAAKGVEQAIVAATDGAAADYFWEGVPVSRYVVPPATRREIVDRLPHRRFDEFAAWLRRQDIDVYHQHSWTRGCGLPHLALARQLGIKTVVTVHVPSVVCLRGTMMLNGTKACDGEVQIARCTECWGEARGIPRPAAAWMARAPEGSTAVGSFLPASRLRTMLRTPHLVADRQADLAVMARDADKVVAVCRWLFNTLALNRFPPDKLVYCPQGVDAPADFDPAVRQARSAGPLRVGFLGRWDPVKGLHVLVSAFLRLPKDVHAELVVHALPDDAQYERDVRAQARGDSRIRFETPLPRHEIFSTLADIDVLAVPSLWLETGPLVVLEALVAGRWVLGSDLGGIPELIRPGVNGQLIRAGDIEAWSLAVAELAAVPDRAALGTVGASSVPVRPPSGRDVADRMHAIYEELTTKGGAAHEHAHVTSPC